MITNPFPAMWVWVVPELGNHLWQSTVFAGAVGMLALSLQRYQARVRYWLWLAASVKFLVPFSLLVSLGSHVAWSHHATASNASVYVALDKVSQPFAGMTALNVPMSANVHSPATHFWIALLPPLLAIVWLCGSVAVLLFWWVQWRRVVVVMRRAEPLGEGREVAILRRVEQAIGVSRRIEVLASRESMEPGVFGVVRPVLLWPQGISQRLDDEQLEAVLAHEVCHVQRRDNLTSLLHMVVEAAFWFHPLVWWMEGRLVEERERACDEEVLRLGKQPVSYAESILKVCEFCVESPLVCLSGVTGADLKKRIAQIMRGSVALKLGLGWKCFLVVAGVLILALPAAFGRTIGAHSVASPLPPGAGMLAAIENSSSSQAQTAEPSFEVATIKPSDPAARFSNLNFGTDRVESSNVPLKFILQVAYDLNTGSSDQIVGAPSWVDSLRFDIDAKEDEKLAAKINKMSPEERMATLNLMIRGLFADRFQLRVHHEVRELPVLALTIAKGGSKLTPAIKTDASDGATSQTTQSWTGLHNPRLGQTEGRDASIPMLVSALSSKPEVGGRLVIDATGLQGNYNFVLNWTPDGESAHSGDSDVGGPSLFTALKQQLGLKLESRKSPVDVLVIDHIEKPSSN